MVETGPLVKRKVQDIRFPSQGLKRIVVDGNTRE
jgi:hypothetical protein